MITYLPDSILFGKGILKYTLNRTEMLLFSDYQSVRCKHLLYMYVFFQCIWFTWDLWWFIRLMRFNSYHYLEFYYFSFTAFHNVSSFLPDMLNLWNVSSAKLYIWCCCYQVTSIGKCLYTTVYSVPLSFSLRVFDSFSFIHLRKYGFLIVSLCKALFFFPYQVLCFYLVCFILYLDLWVLFYVFHCWLSFCNVLCLQMQQWFGKKFWKLLLIWGR